MATAHVYPFTTVKADPRYDSDPVVAPGATTPDERPGDYLPDSPYALSKPHITRDRYPEPAVGDLVTFWQRQGRAVLSVTSGGHTQDFYIAPNVVGHLVVSGVELLEHSTNLRG